LSKAGTLLPGTLLKALLPALLKGTLLLFIIDFPP